MYDNSNIEFINFETITHPEYDNNIEMELGDIDLNRMNDVLFYTNESGYESPYDSILPDSRSHYSLNLDFSDNKLNDSLNSSPEQNSNSKENKKDTDTSSFSEKPYRCKMKECIKSFKYKWILDRHYSAHKSTKMYKCDDLDCNKSYKSKENLTLHIKNIHQNIKPYSCKYCKSVFSHRNGIYIFIYL